jgi:hypothetical protein
MADKPSPLSSSEAWRFEDVAGVTVPAAVRQLRAGELAVPVAVAALLISGARTDPTLTVDDVLDTFPRYLDLIGNGAEHLHHLVVATDGAAEPTSEPEEGR